MTTVDRAASLARLQAALMIAVVASFLVATAVAATRGTAIDADVDAIIGSAMPSVQHLSSARGHLHELDTALADCVIAADDGHPVAARSVDAARHALEASISVYRSSAAGPEDQALFQDIRDSIDATSREADRALAAIRANDRAAYHAALADEHREALHTDNAFETLVAFKASQGERLAVHALAVRRSTLRTAFALDGLAVILAIAATAAAVASLRRGVGALVRASDAAEQRSSELDQFAGRIAHDVLSPLMSVTLALHMVDKRLGSEDPARNAVARATRALLRVRRMVDGLLELARAGARAKPGAYCDLAEVVADVIEGARAEAEARGIALEVPALEDANVACSAGVLTSVVQNLVRNAVKYMGERKEKIVAIRAGTTGGRAWIEVRDTGPGIPADALEKIFEPFVRATTVGEGAGLGLATVKRLVEAHGGRVGCRSRPGEGSVFRVELPVASEASGSAQLIEQHARHGAPRSA